MTNYERPTIRPEGGKILGFDHVHFWVGNAKQSAEFYTSNFGMEYCAYRGLETGERKTATHVVKSLTGNVKFAFSSQYVQGSELEIGPHVDKHGDGVRDVAFNVEDCKALYKKVMSKGAVSVMSPQEIEDENGKCIVASVRTYGDTIHSFIQNVNYKGPFLPGYRVHHQKQALNRFIQPTAFNFIDHCVGNMENNGMGPTCDVYEKIFDFHRFWSVDDSVMHSEYSALRSTVMADFDENVKMPINEPAQSKRKSQIEEYCEYYGGPGVQHIAINCSDVLGSIENMKERGCEFLQVPDSYYDILRKNITKLDYKIDEDIDRIQRNKILLDYDDKGYLLQLFTKPLQDRPTVFFEFIQRHNNQGFGIGNFKSLFEAIELEQSKRGNLVETLKENV